MAFSTHDIVSDSPTNNFCTLNALNLKSNQVLLESNLRFQTFTTNDSDGATSTLAMPNSGKYYIEVVPHDTLDNGSRIIIGVTADPSKNTISQNYVGLGSDTYSWTDRTGAGHGFVSEATSFLFNGDSPTYTVNAIYQIFYDSDNLKIWMGKNNNWYSSSGSISGTPNFSTDQTMQVSADRHQKGMFFLIQIASELGQVKKATINFGQDPSFAGNKSPSTTYTDANGIGAFYYQPPTDALALCTANLPDFTPTVTGDTPQDYFKTLTYTGSTTQTTTLDFNSFTPDLLWIKNRYDSASTNISHALIDSVRGGDKVLASDSTSNESVVSSAVTFNNDNTVSLLAGYSRINNAANSRTYVAWGWKSGGNSNTFNINGTGYSTYSALQTANTSLPASSTSGMIVPSGMSINTAAGFSIVKYQGILDSNTSTATIPHGLASADFCIIKNLDNGNTWVVSHTSITPNVMALQDSGLAASTPPVDPTYGQITSLNSNTVTITRGSTRGDNVGENLNSWGYIMYCWHSVEGFSKFGSYEGSTALPFVETGFRPSFLLLKNADDSTSWVIHDSARDVYNEVENVLVANASTQENTYSTTGVDFLSNGFKMRGDSSWYGNNLSTNQTVIYMAFAEQPFKYANAR